MATIATGNSPTNKRRDMHIREVANGYVLRCEVMKPTTDTPTSYMETELVVTSLPQLLKKVKTFFESEIEEGTE